jgi:motility quorum-sensing regulator/GCU-specific mRNA interferase toxin
MEKNTPHYDLAVVKQEVIRLGAKAFTGSAMTSGKGMGLSLRHMQQAICSLDRRMFYKSMTCYTDHRIWQDVYHSGYYGLELYIKITYCPSGGPPVISFKEKNL